MSYDTSPSIADVLEQAAELLSKPGAWMQGALKDEREGGEECFCALGALVTISSVGFSAAKFLERILPPGKSTDPLCPIAMWNDAPERTQEEVVSKLREGASLARAEVAA